MSSLNIKLTLTILSTFLEYLKFHSKSHIRQGGIAHITLNKCCFFFTCIYVLLMGLDIEIARPFVSPRPKFYYNNKYVIRYAKFVAVVVG